MLLFILVLLASSFLISLWPLLNAHSVILFNVVVFLGETKTLFAYYYSQHKMKIGYLFYGLHNNQNICFYEDCEDLLWPCEISLHYE